MNVGLLKIGKNIKTISGYTLLLIILVYAVSYCGTINESQAARAAKTKLAIDFKNPAYSIRSISPLVRDAAQSLAAYIVELNPTGFFIVSAEDIFVPVLAYSYDNKFGENEKNNPLRQLILTDLNIRKQNYNKNGNTDISIKTEWKKYLSEEPVMLQQAQFQWPKTGTTATGGWLKENWTQSAPYNNFCPMDLINNSRSLAGCPAVAMGMILNYLRTTNRVHFSDLDDYHHIYAGRNYWIDNDYAAVGFPSFPQLNTYLDTLNAHYARGAVITNNDKAALVFASAVAAKQVFTSQASGTFGVDQAKMAYDRFNFAGCTLLWPDEPALYKRIAMNVIDSLTVHFAAVTSDNSAGHNFVVDGYNTDNYFHLNMGWGGSYNSWYKLPDQIPYSLTVVEGVIVDISAKPVMPDGNDLPEDATPLQLPYKSYENKLSNDHDVDWYRFNINAGTNLKLHTETFGCFAVDTKAWLYGPCNQDVSGLDLTNYIAYDDTSFGSQQAAINITLTKPGTYYLRLSAGKNEPAKKAGYDEIGAYLLVIDTSRIEALNVNNSNSVRNRMEACIKNCYPNPFNPAAVIEFSTPAAAYTSLKIFDLLGNEIETLCEGMRPAGEYKITWNASGRHSGMYICELRNGSSRQYKKMLLTK